MKPRLFLPMNTFFPNRHQTFIGYLSSHFSLVLHEAGAWKINGQDIQSTSQISEQIGDVERLPEFHAQFEAYRQFVFDSLSSILGYAPSEEKVENQLKQIRPVLADTLKSALVLDEMSNRLKIDAVVTTTDYTRQARPIIFMAQQRNIPTIHVEHGLFSFVPFPPAGQSQYYMAPFASNYVILDNPLEVSIFERHHLQPSIRQLLPLGTPLDNVSSSNPVERTTGRSFLHLREHEYCITLGLSWSEPHTPYAPARLQQDEVEFVKFVFQFFKKDWDLQNIRIVVKLHPAMADFGAFNEVKAYFNRLAAQYGLANRVQVSVDHLPEIIAASDILLSRSSSSILWDCILQNTPVAIVTPSAWLHQSPPAIPDSAVSDAGLLHYVRNETDMYELCTTNLTPNRKTTYAQLAQRFCQQWGIRQENAATKSARIVNWLTQTLE